jgi:hypothetical protein
MLAGKFDKFVDALIKRKAKSKTYSWWTETAVLIIDMISMVSAELLDGFNDLLGYFGA